MNKKRLALRFLFITLRSALCTLSFPFAIDQTGDEARAESVIYIDDGDVGGAGVEHAEERGHSAK